MSTCQGLFYAFRFGNRVHFTFVFLRFLRRCFLEDFLLFFFFFAQLYDIKHSYLKQIICTSLYGFKYSYLITIIIWFQVIISIL